MSKYDFYKKFSDLPFVEQRRVKLLDALNVAVLTQDANAFAGLADIATEPSYDESVLPNFDFGGICIVWPFFAEDGQTPVDPVEHYGEHFLRSVFCSNQPDFPAHEQWRVEHVTVGEGPMKTTKALEVLLNSLAHHGWEIYNISRDESVIRVTARKFKPADSVWLQEKGTRDA